MTSKIEGNRIVYQDGKPWAVYLKENGCSEYHLKILKSAKDEHLEELVPEIKQGNI